MGLLTVKASGQHLTVDIQTTAAHEAATFSDEALTTPITLPLAITADQDFYFRPGEAVVDVTVTTAAGVVLMNAERHVIGTVDRVVLTPLPTPAQEAATDSASTGGSVALSSLPLAWISVPNQTAAAGTGTTLDFAGGTIQKGAEYWGVPDSAQPLDMAIGGTTTQFVYPADAANALFSVQFTLQLAGNVADAGKVVRCRFSGNNAQAVCDVTLDASGAATVADTFTDQVFLGDTAAHLGGGVNTTGLADDLTVSVTVFVQGLTPLAPAP